MRSRWTKWWRIQTDGEIIDFSRQDVNVCECAGTNAYVYVSEYLHVNAYIKQMNIQNWENCVFVSACMCMQVCLDHSRRKQIPPYGLGIHLCNSTG